MSDRPANLALPVGVFGRRRLIRRPLTRSPRAVKIGAVILAVVVLACVLIPLLWNYSPDALVGIPLQSPSFAHPFGTDELGRDVFVRTMAGGRVDIVIAAFAVLLSGLIGSIVGTTAALAGRWLDAGVMRLADALIAFPFTILVLTVVLLFGTAQAWGPFPAGTPGILFAIVVTDWAIYARLSRAQALSLRNREFMVATQTLGYSFGRRVVRHLMPNLVGVVGAYMVTDAVIVVLTVAALPFLGAGIQPPAPEWGAIMQDGSGFLASAWWIIVGPGVVLALTATGLSLVADGMLSRAAGHE